MKKSVILLVLILACLSTLTFAQKKQRFYPRGCTPDTVKEENGYVILGTEANDRTYRVYVFKNISPDAVVLKHEAPDDPLGNMQTSTIRSQRWTAILVAEDNFKVGCSSDGGYFIGNVPCSDVVKACEMAVSPVMDSAQGEYWVTENQSSKSGLFRGIRARGIYP